MKPASLLAWSMLKSLSCSTVMTAGKTFVMLPCTILLSTWRFSRIEACLSTVAQPPSNRLANRTIQKDFMRMDFFKFNTMK